MSISASAAATRAPVIPLICELNITELRKAKLVHTVQILPAADNRYEKRIIEIPLVDTPNVELILRVIEEFQDVAQAGRLSLTTGPLKFAKFHECLEGSIRDQWDVVKSQVATETNATFETSIAAFIKKFLKDTDLMKQKLYMDTTRKPFRLSCRELSSRYLFLNNLMKWFPSANGNKLYDDNALKFLFHSAMLDSWQDSFARSNLDFTSDYDDIVRYFEDQEEIHNRARGNSSHGGRGGRGGGRGRNQGRGGRNYQGRGYQGRGNYNNYYGGGYYRGYQGRGGYAYQGQQPAGAPQAGAAYNTPPNQYRRLDTPPTRVSSSPSSSPRRYSGYRGGGAPGRYQGRGRFQQVPVHRPQGVHYVDDSAYYLDAGDPNAGSEEQHQDNYVSTEAQEEQEDYQEYITDHDAYFGADQGYEEEGW